MQTFREFLTNRNKPQPLHTNPSTPLHVGQNTTDFNKPNILWITGMNSTGGGVKQLAALGYPVKMISTAVNWPTTITGRLKRYPVLKQMIGKKADQMGDNHMSDQVQKVHSELPVNWHPDIVIGTSQGGAVAMASAPLFPTAHFIVGASAWKIFNVEPKLPSGSIILHGNNDKQVPLADAKELSQLTGAKLVVTGDGHDISLPSIVQAIKTLTPEKHQ